MNLGLITLLGRLGLLLFGILGRRRLLALGLERIHDVLILRLPLLQRLPSLRLVELLVVLRCLKGRACLQRHQPRARQRTRDDGELDRRIRLVLRHQIPISISSVLVVQSGPTPFVLLALAPALGISTRGLVLGRRVHSRRRTQPVVIVAQAELLELLQLPLAVLVLGQLDSHLGHSLLVLAALLVVTQLLRILVPLVTRGTVERTLLLRRQPLAFLRNRCVAQIHRVACYTV